MEDDDEWDAYIEEFSLYIPTLVNELSRQPAGLQIDIPQTWSPPLFWQFLDALREQYQLGMRTQIVLRMV